jgi:hypothetical protein
LAGANSSNLGVLYDVKMTGRLGQELAREMHACHCTGRVLERATRERPGRFRRQCAVFLYRRWGKQRSGTRKSGTQRSGKQTAGHSPFRRAGRRKAPLTLGLAAALLALASHFGHARDRGQYANATPELKAWFEGLKSGKGPCCSDSDGTAVSDVDWQSHGGHYLVRLDGEWVEVPDEAVITEPNRIGRTMVWPLRGYLGLTIP